MPIPRESHRFWSFCFRPCCFSVVVRQLSYLCGWSVLLFQDARQTYTTVSVSAMSFLNFQIVFASGTLSHRFIPRNLIKLILSLIWYSVWSSDRLYSRCNTSILNIITTSYDGRHPFPVSSLRLPWFSTLRNFSHLITLFNISNGSPNWLSSSYLFSSSNSVFCFISLLYHFFLLFHRGF